MVKVLDGEEGRYVPHQRSLHWFKIKKDYVEGVTDTLDLVPIGVSVFVMYCYDHPPCLDVVWVLLFARVLFSLYE